MCKQKSGACAPLFCFRFSIVNCGLTPVAFDHDPAVAAPFPVMGNPNGAIMRRMRPVAMNPYVAVTIPTMIAIVPHPSGMRWMLMMLNDRRRRCNAHNNLCQCNRRSETQSEQPCQKSLFHRNLNLRGSDLPESVSLFLAVNDNNTRVRVWLRVVEKSSTRELSVWLGCASRPDG